MLHYDPQTGDMLLNTLGLNQLNDSVRPGVGFDDVEMASISIVGPAANFTHRQFVGFVAGDVWHSIYFNGRQQVFGHHGNLDPGFYRVLSYDTGLTEADFGDVEFGMNFGRGTLGPSVIGRVQIIGTSGGDSGEIYHSAYLGFGDGCGDLNALSQMIAAGGYHHPKFDLNGDGRLTELDMQRYRELVVNIEGGDLLGLPSILLPGDANIDGVVDISDFNIWNEHKFTDNANYCDGDFNADGVVDSSDFNVWNEHKFQGQPMAVPEPSSWLIAIAMLAMFSLHSKR